MIKAALMWACFVGLLLCCASGKGLRRHRRGIRFQAQESQWHPSSGFRALPLDAKQQQEMKKLIYTLDADEVDPPLRPSELAFPCMSQMQFAINGKPRKPNQVTYALKSHRAPTGSLLTVEATGTCEAFPGPTTTFYLRANTSDLPVFGDIFIRHAFGFLSIVMPPGSVQHIMDLGTNVGLSLLYWATRYPDAKVIGVEPELGNFGVASLNVAHRPNVFLERAAVTDRLGLSNLKVLTQGDWGFGTEHTTQLTDPKGFSSLTIPYLMTKYGWNKIDILKVDIEGAELGLCQEIARGAAWIKMVRCVTFEYHDRLFPELATSIQDTCNNAARKEGMTFYGHFKVDHLFLWCR